MTDTAQDFSIQSGDDRIIAFSVYSDAANTIPLDISSVTQIEWYAMRDLQSSPVLSKTKTGGAISLVGGGTGGQFQVAIASADTTSLSGYYIHRARITDSQGNKSTVTLGRLQVGQAPVWTYSGDPANSARDAVRSYIADTDESDPQLFDSEIDYELTVFPNAILAASSCARKLATRYARKVNKRVGDLSISYGDIGKQYAALADELESRGNSFGLEPYSGGTSIADKRAVASNTDRPRPPFRRNQFNKHRMG